MDSILRQRQIFLEQLGYLILEYGLDQESLDTDFLGVQLLLISEGLGTVNLEALANDDILELNKVIEKLVSITKIAYIPLSLGSKVQTDLLRNNLAEYLKSLDHNECQELSKTCEGLVKALQMHESMQDILANPPKSEKIEYPMSVKRKLLSGLRNDSICASCVGLDESQGSPQRHSTRLLLQQKPREDNCDTINFNAIIARIPQEGWKDVGLSVPLEDSVELSAGNDSCNSPNYGPESNLGQIVFCPILKDNDAARSHFVFRNGHFSRLPNVQALEQQPCPGSGITLTAVLQQYTLELKDKVKLAHTIAQTLWQFYDTELLYRKWDSDCILFMPEEHEGVQRVPIKPYVSIQFEASEENTDEYLSEAFLIHRYPRILAFAIMLVEIGLGKPLQLEQCDNLVAQSNTDFEAAFLGLNDLKETPWENSLDKSAFIKAIENCLEYKNFGPVDTTSAAVPSPAGNQDGRNSLQIDHTRRAFYDKVVWPLQWLAEVGFPGDQSGSYLRENQRSLQVSRASSTRKDLEEDIQFPPTEFHASRYINPKDWLRNLKAINKEIHPKLQNLVVDGQGVRVGERGIRVAILDTGYDPKAPLLVDKSVARRFKGWKDFVSGSDVPVDSFGHGTFMATVLIHSAPISEVHVARVAENTNNLDQCSHQVAEGIRWAAFEQNADVISMSFGFPASDVEACKRISEAIEEVEMKRNGRIIFLASAGNSGVYEDETFPATHQSVISIRATDCFGKFMKTHPRNSSGNSVVFGAVGDDIPPHLREFYPEVSLPGTSAATAVAADTAVIMLAYVLILPQLLKIEIQEHKLKLLWTTEGMRRMFMKMSDDMGQQQRFLDPVKFFYDKPGPFDRYCAIYDCL
ncbi:hypothetical protein CI102_73 [Trichoderma harzianum]|uniref:Uncharacterized protein n=1 Tax=Trichoderma harzianum CBS 226.95 TaxID=983964 RepID=A0A2T3ZSZ3_TRIHA|nr:hypothetical protein M431DRAFT_11340 [Trichoderma harzianum CBS 226.95]PKK55073.1 hypothetical protein CI102_73 [Trichoderma harzianum]PTB47920.1 hypothetical protein M431DRAFT_11340 [Trichoderma harzianum CBS 226.95]